MFDFQNSEFRGVHRLVRKLGGGGMGTVYEAWDTRLGRRVAVKYVHPHLLERDDIRARFDWEARLAARVEHPNVVRIYRVDSWNDQPVIEMQYVEGMPLRDVLRGGPLSPSQAIRLLAQLLEALAACHRQGVVHCDLKPGNLLITAEEHLWLTDFGVARAMFPIETEQSPGQAPDSPAWGTAWYMPPEAFQGVAPSCAWDLYAAGMVAFEMIAGQPPFIARSPQEWINLVRSNDAPRLDALTPRVSKAAADLIASLIARDPAQRPSEATSALKRLRETPESFVRQEDTLAPTMEARPATHADKGPTQLPSRSARWLMLGALTGVVVLGLALYALTPLSRAPVSTESFSSIDPQPKFHHEITDLTVSKFASYFAFDDGIHGNELWVAGIVGEAPRMVADIVPGPGSSSPRRFVTSKSGTLYFAASTPETGEELWSLANGASGDFAVSQVRDILPGPMGSEPEPIAMDESLVLFYATTLSEGRELWCSNGNGNQTAIVADASPGRDGSYPMRPYIAIAGKEVYLTGFGGAEGGLLLWKYDFGQNMLSEVAAVPSNTTSLVVFQGKLFFTREDAAHGAELWVHDPAVGGATLFADLWPGVESSSPHQFFVWHDHLLFQARSEANGFELWSSDGTPQGTALLEDINPGPASSWPFGFTGAANEVFFRAQDNVHGKEPWVTSLVPNSTHMLTDVNPGAQDSGPYNYAVSGDTLSFTANDGVHGEEMFLARQDGDGWAVSLLADILPGSEGSEPHDTQWLDQDHTLSVAHGDDDVDVLISTSIGRTNSKSDALQVIALRQPGNGAK